MEQYGFSSLDFYNEFKNFATNKLGISGMQLHYWEQLQNQIYSNIMVPSMNMLHAESSLTPYIIEERKLNVTQMDIFSRMMMNRILWVAGPVNDRMSNIVSAQLLFLDDLGQDDITMNVDSPGGSVKSGLTMVDTMNYILSDVSTINMGMAASMGSILLGAGAKGKRFTLKHSRVMLHQVSAGAQGHVKDMNISIAEANKYNDELFRMLGEYCGKTREEVLADCERDNWLNAEEAKAYGIVDGIITKKRAKN